MVTATCARLCCRCCFCCCCRLAVSPLSISQLVLTCSMVMSTAQSRGRLDSLRELLPQGLHLLLGDIYLLECLHSTACFRKCVQRFSSYLCPAAETVLDQVSVRLLFACRHERRKSCCESVMIVSLYVTGSYLPQERVIAFCRLVRSHGLVAVSHSVFMW